MREPLICYSVFVVILWPWNKHIETATVIGTLDNESFCAEYHAVGKDFVQNGLLLSYLHTEVANKAATLHCLSKILIQMVWVDLVNSKLQHFMRVRRVETEQLSCETMIQLRMTFG